MSKYKKLAVFTATRAEYGLLKPLMTLIKNDSDVELKLIVSGTHLSPEFGETGKAIETDGFEIDEKVEMLLSSDSRVGTVKSAGLGMIGYADALDRIKPDMLILLGDRYEALAMAQAALLMNIPVAHLHGGEITEGAYDDAIRHAISKLSLLHFASTEEHKNRVVQMGEEPSRVYNVGAVGLDGIVSENFPDLPEINARHNLDLSEPYIVVTYHAVTAGNEPPRESFTSMMKAFDAFPDHKIVITYPNADNGGRAIIEEIKKLVAAQPERVGSVISFGHRDYLAAVSKAAAVVGNSSSALIEVPALNVPVINVGMRQLGRTASDATIHSSPDTADMKSALEKALAKSYKDFCVACPNPYGKGGASAQILHVIKNSSFSLPKKFHEV